MLSYMMRETLIAALAAGSPHHVISRNIDALTQMEVLTELARRGLITRDALPVLTEAGIAEAKWFANPDKEES